MGWKFGEQLNVAANLPKEDKEELTITSTSSMATPPTPTPTQQSNPQVTP